MYTNDNLDIIQDNQAFTHIDGTKYPSNYPKDEVAGLYPVTLTDQPTGDIVITGFHIDANHNQVWDYRSKTAEELLSEKQSLINQIEAKQREIFPLADGMMSKQKRRELSDKITKTEQEYNVQVALWADEVGYQNNVVTKIDLTLASNLTSGNSTCTLASASGVSTLGKIVFANVSKTWSVQVLSVNGNAVTLDDVSPVTFNTSATVQYIQSVRITTDLTKEALQARLDRLTELEASFPNI